MKLKTIGLVPPLLVLWPLASAFAAGIPKLDYRKTCEATPSVGMDKKATVVSCLHDEENALKQLPEVWGKSTKESKDQCVGLTTLAGMPSYVELYVCLLGNVQAKDIPKE